MYYHNHNYNYSTTEHILCFYGIIIVGQNTHIRNFDVLFIFTYGILLYFFSTL